MFGHILSFAKDVERRNPQGLIEVVRLLLRPLQSELLASAVMNGIHEARGEIGSVGFFMPGGPSDMQYCGKDPRLEPENFRVHLNRDPVLPCPWHRGRYVDALSLIGSGKSRGRWEEDRTNHVIVLWLPWGIPFVTGGNHSIASGILGGEGILRPTEVYDMSRLLAEVHCDGKFFRSTSDNRVLDEVRDGRIAALFEIGRMIRSNGLIPMQERGD